MYIFSAIDFEYAILVAVFLARTLELEIQAMNQCQHLKFIFQMLLCKLRIKKKKLLILLAQVAT